MIRLIDADALMLKICGEGCGCMPDQCGYPYCGKEGNEIRCRTGEYVENAPTIDAIPVEWLKQYAPEKWSTYMQAAVEIIIEAWLEEQEGRR